MCAVFAEFTFQKFDWRLIVLVGNPSILQEILGKVFYGTLSVFCKFLFFLSIQKSYLQTGYVKPCYEPLWPTMTHYDPQWPKIFTLWTTLIQNLVNCFTMTQNKVLGIFISLNFIPKILFLGKFGPKTWKCFV